MKKMSLVLTSILAVSIFATGCTKVPEGSEKEAYKLLLEANKNFEQLNSYVEVKYQYNKVGSEDYETRVNFLPLSKDGEGKITIDRDHNYEIAYPNVSVKTNEDMQKNKPTLINVSGEKADDKYVLKVYREFPDVKELSLFSQSNYESQNTTLDFKAVQDILKEAKKAPEPTNVDDEKANAGHIYTYTGGNFTSQVFPEKIKNLKTKEEKTIGDTTYEVLSGQVNGVKGESGFLYKKADIEIWINKETHELVRETFDPSKYAEDTKEEGFTTFEYVSQNKAFTDEAFYKKDIQEQLKFMTTLFK